MRLDLYTPEVWQDINSAVKEKYWSNLDNIEVRCYPGLKAAVYEIVTGTTAFMSHKRSVGLVRGCTNAFEDVLPFLFRDGFDVQYDMTQLKKDTSLVMLADDHPVTGEIFNNEALDTELNNQKIFSIRVSHASHFFGFEKINPYTVVIQSISPNLAIAICGNRFKSPVLFSSGLSWSLQAVEGEYAIRKENFKQDKAVVEKFLKTLPAGWKNLELKMPTLYDRALVYNADLTSDCAQQEIAKKINLQIAKPGYEMMLETVHGCRWNSLDAFSWWQGCPNQDVLRGLLIFNSLLLPKINPTLLSQVSSQCQINLELK